MKRSLFFIFLISILLIVQSVSADTYIEAGDLSISLDPVTGALIVTNDGIPTDEFADFIFLGDSGGIVLSSDAVFNVESLTITSSTSNINLYTDLGNSNLSIATTTDNAGIISIASSGTDISLYTDSGSITLSSETILVDEGSIWTGIDISSDGLIISSTDSLDNIVYADGSVSPATSLGTEVVYLLDGPVIEPVSSSNGAYGAVVFTTYTTSVAPEPISSILFLIGGTFLAGRKFFKRN